MLPIPMHRLAVAMVVAALAAPFTALPLQAESPVLLTPSQSAPLRDAPPSGIFLRPGTQLSQTDPNDTYVVLDQYQAQTGIAQTQSWIRVAPIDPQTGSVDLEHSGWVYYGTNAPGSAATSPNFTTTDPAQISSEALGTIFLQIAPAN